MFQDSWPWQILWGGMCQQRTKAAPAFPSCALAVCIFCSLISVSGSKCLASPALQSKLDMLATSLLATHSWILHPIRHVSNQAFCCCLALPGQWCFCLSEATASLAFFKASLRASSSVWCGSSFCSSPSTAPSCLSLFQGLSLRPCLFQGPLVALCLARHRHHPRAEPFPHCTSAWTFPSPADQGQILDLIPSSFPYLCAATWVWPVHNSPRVKVFVKFIFTEFVQHVLFTFSSVLLGHTSEHSFCTPSSWAKGQLTDPSQLFQVSHDPPFPRASEEKVWRLIIFLTQTNFAWLFPASLVQLCLFKAFSVEALAFSFAFALTFPRASSLS